MTERQILERLKKLQSNNTKVDKKDEERLKEVNERKKRWITFWRKNPNLYIHYIMGVNSYPYQHYSYYLMGDSTQYVDVSTRGVSKTFKAITFGVSHCLMFPYAKVGVCAVTAGQSNEDYDSTFIGDLVNKNSPFLKWLWDSGLITSKVTEKGYRIDFWNGSVMYFFPCIDSSRGLHVDLLIIEECRLIKKSLVDGVALPMHTLRQPQYVKNKKYSTYKSEFDVLKIIYITSNRYEDEWFNTMFNKTVVGYFNDKFNKYKVFCSDIFLAIKYNLKDINWFMSQKRTMNELEFRMEVLNETIGEVEGAYFSRELFSKNQILKKAWKPLTPEDIKLGNKPNRPKRENEYRFIFLDFAWVEDNNGSKNDNTVIGCASCYIKNDILYRNVEHIETYGGEFANDVPLRVKELFWDFQADYIVMDANSAGEILYNQLTAPMPHPKRSPDDWNEHGLSICLEKDLNMVNSDKFNQFISRAVDPQSVPCIIPINSSANSDWNSNMWVDLNTRLRNSEIAFLIDDLEFKTWFEIQKEWFKLTSDEKADIISPYVQTSLLINEAVNLTSEWKEGKLKLKEPRSGTKDRIVAVAYFNAVATKLENKLAKQAQQQEINWTDYQFIV